MKWIGLTGGIGSGKSTVGKILKSKGFPVIDADHIARQLLQPGEGALEAVSRTFGQKLIGPDGSLDRKALGRMVFQDPSQLQILEGILHPLVKERVTIERKKLKESGESLAFYDVPLLFEKNMQDQFDAVVVVNAPKELRVERVMERDHISRKEVLERMSRQLSLSEKVAKADYIIENSSDEKTLRINTEDVLSRLLPGPGKAPHNK